MRRNPQRGARSPGDENVVRLRQELRRLHRYAGEPSTREIVRDIGRGRISHTTVGAILRCETVPPGWSYVEMVVKVLGGDVESVRQLWVDARSTSAHPASGDDASTTDGKETSGAPDHRPSPVVIREYLARTRRTGSTPVSQILVRAADQTASAAPHMAAELILEALTLDRGDESDWAQLLGKAVWLLASTGQSAEARKLGESVLSGELDPATEATVLVGLAEALKHAGQNQQAADYASRALDRPGVPPDIQARLYAVLAHALLYLDRATDADEAGQRAYDVGLSCREYGGAVFGNTARSIVARFEGRLSDALEYASDAVVLADREGGLARHRHPRIWLGGVLACLDRFDEAERAYDTGSREAERLGTGWSQPLWHYMRSCLLLWRGRLDESVDVARAGIDIASQLTAQQLSVPLHGLLARVAALRSDISGAHGHLAQMRKLIQAGITAAHEDVDWSTAMVQRSQGHYQSAFTTLAGIYRSLPHRTLLLSTDPAAAAILVGIPLELYAQRPATAGLREQAELVVGVVRDLANRNPAVASLAGAADHAEGLLLGDLDALRAAVAHFRHSPRPLARTAAMIDTAVAERAAGGRGRAVDLLHEALVEAERCGAHELVSRVRQSLTEIDPGYQVCLPLEAIAVSALASLSRAELPVARLAAAGHTNTKIANMLYISPHTVDSHLRHIFEKLRINSRVELTQIMVRYGEDKMVAF